ncbi:Subtilase family [Bifidobacterium leontopitheci]|uniref:Subtilase family n=2 Tax=Bifidobacterium leontopitheci TaxID=2650774 RepID=A0A6I1GLC0_9BIFI|nr:Subtilase family [Bifidobacterium leontopitheci]
MRWPRAVWRMWMSVMTTLMALSIVVMSVVPQASASEDGLWPVNDAVRRAWSQGIDGSGVKVTVIDDMPIADHPDLQGADITYSVASFYGMDRKEPVYCSIGGQRLQQSLQAGDTFGGAGPFYSSHGTLMLQWIVGSGKGYEGKPDVRGIADGAEIDFHAINFSMAPGMPNACSAVNGSLPGINFTDILQNSVIENSRVVNMSFGVGLAADDISSFVSALRHGVIMVSGRANTTEAGSDSLTGDPRANNYFPGVVTVNSMMEDGSLAPSSDTADGNVSVLSPGYGVLVPAAYDYKDVSTGNGGTSTAAAVLSAYVTLAIQKWPKATGNQILQSLVRNTQEAAAHGGAWLDPEHRIGFGRVDVDRLLTVDPTSYPDINPILEIQVKNAAKNSVTKDWYTQDCGTNPDGVGGAADDVVPCEAGLIGKEYERQKAAWAKVKQCRSDGGSDCMRYSATATADDEEGASQTPDDGSETKSRDSAVGVPTWAWWVAGGGGLFVVAGGVAAGVIASRRRRRTSYRGSHVQPVRSVAAGPRPPQYVPGPRSSYPSQSGYPMPGQGAARHDDIGAGQAAPYPYPGSQTNDVR